MANHQGNKATGHGKASVKAEAEAPPWEQKKPQGSREQPLSAEAKSKAKQRAKKAGRPYPNLVDNMQAAKESKA